MRTSPWLACRWPWSLGSSRHSPKVHPCQKAQSRTGRRGRRERLNQSGCPSGRLGLTRTDEHRVSAFRVDGVQRCQSATRWVTRNWPRGLSSEEFFGLHCQMLVQLCNGVVGHLADLQKHKMRQPGHQGWKRAGEKHSRTLIRLSGK